MYTKFGVFMELQTNEEKDVNMLANIKMTLIGFLCEKETININILFLLMKVVTTGHCTATSMKPLTSGYRWA